MAYFAAVFTRHADGWNGTEVDLDVETVDDVADLMRDHATDREPVVLFTEEDDEWFAVVRLDGDEPRTFISDTRAPLSSHKAEVLVVIPADEPVDEEESESGRGVGGEPGGDDELLADLGVDATLLHDVATREGLLPGDALLEIAESLGAGDAYEQLR